MPREIQIANAAGFCFGVKKAIQKAETMEKAFIFGSLIHNPQEVARLASLNKKIVHKLEDVAVAISTRKKHYSIAQPNTVRVTIIAEKTDAMMPTVSVTAKPFTGPEDFQKRIAAVRN